jgi:hypothetical protein
MCSGLIVAACGGDGGSIDSYEAGVEAHTKVMTEMVKVLEGVTDEASANKAAAEIEELGGRLASISAQMAEIPRPDAAVLQKLAKQRRAEGMAFQERAAAQMEKLAQYPVLLEAWTRAMDTMR